MQRVAFIAASLLLLASLPATAQEKGQAGLVTGYPATIGLIWHATDRVAIRPDVSVTHSSSESQSGGSTVLSTSGWGVGFDVAALFYMSKSDNVRTYCSPQFGYTRTTTESEPSAGLARSESTANTYSVAGAFGAQYLRHAPVQRVRRIRRRVQNRGFDLHFEHLALGARDWKDHDARVRDTRGCRDRAVFQVRGRRKGHRNG